MRSILPIALAAVVAAMPGVAEEGLWLYNRFPRQDVEKRYGVKITDGFLDNLRLSSVRFNNGGSGSFVSPRGLLFTNHHVGAECIYKVSTKENDYIANGFQARSLAEEKPCGDLEVNVLLAIETVTAKVNDGVTAEMPAAEAARRRRANSSRLEKECTTATGNRCEMVTLYSGGQYDLYQYKKYTDVRLVFAPEEAIAAFGGDPDNFTFPRYCLDFALFRAYENGKPAEVKNYLRWSKTGAKDGELIFVSGHPGKTDRLATVAELEFQRDVVQPYSLRLNKLLIADLLAFGAKDPENKRVARDLLATLQNSVKARTGFLAGLEDPALMKIKREQETTLRKAIADDPAKQAKYGKTWEEIRGAFDEYRKFYSEYGLLERAPGTGSELFGIGRAIVRYTAETAKPNGERLREWSEANLPSQEQAMFSPAPIYDSLETLTLTRYFSNLRAELGADHPVVRQVLNGKEPAALAAELVAGTKLKDVAVRKELAGHADRVADSTDPVLRVIKLIDPAARVLRQRYQDKVEAVTSQSASKIAQARFAIYGDQEYPDATFTLRLTYAPVKGYVNAKGEKVPWATTFAGVYRRATGTAPFALPPSWLKKKPNLSVPFDFVSTADTHGGNSGSPTVNARGELVGILFDGNLEGLPNQYVYRDVRERSVHVASQGIVEALRSVYGAGEILRELGF